MKLILFYLVSSILVFFFLVLQLFQESNKEDGKKLRY